MTRPLDIQPAGAIDVLALGALVHRLDPGAHPLPQGDRVPIHVSGGEFNVRGQPGGLLRPAGPAIATAMVEYPIGDLIAERVRAMGVQPFYKRFAHDGVHGPEHGHGLQRPRVTASARRSSSTTAPTRRPRGSSPATSTGSRSSPAACAGSTPAASSRRCRRRRAELIIEAMQAAKAAGAIVSFDLNFREKLWTRRRAAPSARSSTLRRIVEHVDVLVGNEEDLQKGLGIAGTARSTAHVEARSQRLLRHDRPRRRRSSRT